MFKVPVVASTVLATAALHMGCSRSIATSSALHGKRNFRKFLLHNKRGPRLFKQQRITNPDPEMPVDKRGVRDTGYTHNGRYVEFAEMIPQLIVPDLTGCQLKPYVSYKTPDVVQTEFTSRDLFDAVYSKKIVDDFKAAKLNADGSAKEPSDEERLSPDEAWKRARRTGSDIF